MTPTKRMNGFTLLELLLTVGIAAVLIIAGITVYGMVRKGNMINETVKFTNLLYGEMRKLRQTRGNLSVTVYDAYLINSGAVPEKYKTTAAGWPLGSPGCAGECQGTDVWSNTGQDIRIAISLPPAYVPEFAAKFDPRTNPDVVSITLCGSVFINATTNPSAVNTASIAATCGSDTNTRENVFAADITFR